MRIFLTTFATAFCKECKTYLLYSLTFTTTRKEQIPIIGAAPVWAQISPVYRYGLW